MNYSAIKYYDIANGPGVRVSLFCSGCRNHCKGCFNQETWDFNHGKEFTDVELNSILEATSRSYITGLTLLGGEPLEPENLETMTKVAREFKKRNPNKTLWLYSGYRYENVKDYEIFDYVDYFIDGKFEIDRKDISLHWRGSLNQRIIDIPSTRREGIIKLHDIIFHEAWERGNAFL